MRILMAAVIVMGVLIVAGVATVVVTIVSRMGGPSTGGAVVQAMLDEPEGTRIAGTSTSPDRVVVQLQGGGPDRIAVVDTRAGRVVARISLAK